MKIILGIILLLIVLLLIPVVIVFEANPSVSLVIKYFGFKKDLLLKEDDGKVKAKKPEKKKSAKEKKQKKKTASTFSIKDIWGLYLKLHHRVAPKVRKLLRRTSVGKFHLRMVVVGRDAADTALSYGKANAAVYSIVALLDRIFTLRAERIDIVPGFGAEKGTFHCSGVIKLTPLVVGVAALQIGFWALLAVMGLKRADDNAIKKTGPDKAAAKDGKEEKNGKEAPAK